MELTRENYYEIEPTILKDIENSEFIAFDLEFSGLIPSKFKIFDSPEENFQKSKIMAENYRIIQVGITPFLKKENNIKGYIAKPYNIYVFPSEKQNNSRFDSFLESIIFNREHGCDFNKWICHGVPYLNTELYKKLSERLMSGNINKYDPKNPSLFRKIVLYKDQDKIRYTNFMSKFNDFYNNKNETIFKHEKIVRHLVLFFLNNLDQDIRNKIFIEYKDETVGEETKSFIIIHKLNSFEEKMEKINQENNEIISLIHREKGVKNLIDKIIQTKKPIVGHNCYIDLLFIMSHFMDDIPKNLNVFKLKLKNEFNGGIYDTKYIYNSSPYNFSENKKENSNKNNINLECLYTNLFEENTKLENDKKISIEIPKNEKFIDYLDEKSKEIKFHQADFDSFTTGCAYAYMLNMLGEKFIKEQENKLNCYHGLYSCYDLNNTNDKEEMYLSNSTDAYVLKFNEKYYGSEEMMKKINEEVINSKFINCKIFNGGVCIVFLNSENKNDFIQICTKFNDFINVKSILEYKDTLNQKYYK